MEILERKEKDIGIVTINGNIVAQTVGEIKQYMETYIEQLELKGVILDCEYVDFIDSAGLGILASIFKTLQKLEKKFALASVNSRIMETFTLTNLNNIFILTADIPSAIKSIQ